MRTFLRNAFRHDLGTKLATCAALAASSAISSAQLSVLHELSLTATVPGQAERFGSVVALSGDLLAIAAPAEGGLVADFGGLASGGSVPRTGTVYLYRRASTSGGQSWRLEGRLKSAAPREGATFGASLALHGDLLAVGKPGDSTRGPNSGGCELWRRTNEAGTLRWSLALDLDMPVNDGDKAGWSVAVSSNALAVGIPFESSDGVPFLNDLRDNSGGVYLLRFQADEAGNLQPLSGRLLKAPVIDSEDLYGFAVALGEGFLAVGAPGESSNGSSLSDNSLPNSGAVFVYDTLASSAQLLGCLKASNRDASDLFGAALSASGARVAVGAPYEDARAAGLASDPLDDSAADSGAAYIFRRTSTGFDEERYLKPLAANSGANFGWSLALDAQRLLVGAPDAQAAQGGTGGPALPFPGIACLYAGVGGALSEVAAFTAPAASGLLRFGTSLALSGDRLVVGAPETTVGGVAFGGAAHAFRAMVDCDGDGLDDAEELAAGASDCDANGRPDNCDADINGDGVADACQEGGVANCFGDGHQGACPCGNRGAIGRGCANSTNPAGARLDAEGLPSREFDSLRLIGSGMTSSSAVLYFQATGGSPGTPFGDGLRCTSGTVLRLGATTNVAGASSWPAPGAPRISVGGQIGGHLGQRTYQAWYRDVNPFFCVAGARFNLTNAVRVTWVP